MACPRGLCDIDILLVDGSIGTGTQGSTLLKNVSGIHLIFQRGVIEVHHGQRATVTHVENLDKLESLTYAVVNGVPRYTFTFAA